MSSSIFYATFLILHLIGLTIMAGTTLIDLIGYRTYWKYHDHNKDKSDAILQLLAKLARPVGIGAALLVFSGLGMMVITHGIFGEQIWFRIKFGLVIILIANNLLFGRRQGAALKKAVSINEASPAWKVEKIKKNMNLFHFSQLLIFLVIIFLSVFKFN
ncbi:MAG: hypothetical protein JWM28_1866 [Chitinophagaceae bacterium]|nr:hypothetical protein [Chitinophagaceae bacterium]